MNLIETAQLGMEWENLILKAKPEYFVTLTFMYSFGDSVTEEAMRFFIRAINNRLPRKHRGRLNGFVCAERIIRKAKYEGTYHFHILLCDLNSKVENTLAWLTNSVNQSCRRLRSPAGVRMADVFNTNVQSIKYEKHKKSKCILYCTKDIYRFDRPSGWQILFIKNGEVTDRLHT